MTQETANTTNPENIDNQEIRMVINNDESQRLLPASVSTSRDTIFGKQLHRAAMVAGCVLPTTASLGVGVWLSILTDSAIPAIGLPIGTILFLGACVCPGSPKDCVQDSVPKPGN